MYLNETRYYFCPETTNPSVHVHVNVPYRNDFSTMLFNPGELAITQLFQLSPGECEFFFGKGGCTD